MDSPRQPPIGFAHRGARAHAQENTLDAFRLALRLGATGLESDVWLTADGVPVLDHDGVVRSGLRRRPIHSMVRADLPDHIPTLEDLYQACGTGFELSLDVKDPEAAGPVVATAARAAGRDASAESGTGGSGPATAAGSGRAGRPGDADAVTRLWLCHPDWQRLASWREFLPDAKLVDSTRLRRLHEGPERRAAILADRGIDAINMHATDWTPGLTTLFHRFERLAFAWDAQFERVLKSLVQMGCDAVYSDYVDRMVSALTAGRTSAPEPGGPSEQSEA